MQVKAPSQGGPSSNTSSTSHSPSTHYSLLASKTTEYTDETDPQVSHLTSTISQVVSLLHHLLHLAPSTRLADLGAGACRLAAALHRCRREEGRRRNGQTVDARE